MVKLRGHHLKNLKNYLIEKNNFEKSLKVNNSHFSHLYIDLISQGYGEFFSRNCHNVYETIISNPIKEIELTLTFDDVCNMKCENRDIRCKDDKDDIEVIKEFGFEPNKVYLCREITEILSQQLQKLL